MNDNATPEPAPGKRVSAVRIGVLGAARVAGDAIVRPARETGSRLVVVAARDRTRGEAFAAENDVERVAGSYQEVVDDPEVDLVYNPLPNSMHAPWNLAAIAAGKHVLSEKPFSANAAEATQVRDAGAEAGVVVADGMHYRYHPVTQRLLELVARGDLGEIVKAEATVVIPRPPAGDLRLDAGLAGGSLMDGGCYAVHAIGLLGQVLAANTIQSAAGPNGGGRMAGAEGREFADLPGVDEEMRVGFELPGGGEGIAHSWMNGDRVELSITVTGRDATARVENFILPHTDDRLTITWPGGRRVEHLGTRSSYTYQLEAVLRAIRYGDALPTDADDAVRTMTAIDAAYAAALQVTR